MQKWKESLLGFMNNNGLTVADCIQLTNKNGGRIKQSGFSHWMNEKEKRSPGWKNAQAIKKMTKGEILAKDIYQEK